ncbi:hypothetical protein Ciccas_013489 [Cichlidogyrus casuarinus]|uniref:Uncharacterized protein n=1 Tax=Cichlidogyrus casuarinus TaxID=1844966 RepID=A0ABD2PQI0_9PLAT
MSAQIFLTVSLLLLLSCQLTQSRPEDQNLCERNTEKCQRVKKSFTNMEDYIGCIVQYLNRTSSKSPHKAAVAKLMKLLDGKRCLARGHMIEIGEVNRSPSEKRELSKIIQGNGILGDNRLFRDIQYLEQEVASILPDYSLDNCRWYRDRTAHENRELQLMPDPTTPPPPSASEVKNVSSDCPRATKVSFLLVILIFLFAFLNLSDY